MIRRNAGRPIQRLAGWSSPYPPGCAATSTDSGQTFTPDTNADLKFLTVVGG